MSFAPTGMFRDLPKVVSDLNPLETQPLVDTLTKCQPFRFPPTDYATWRQLDINYEHKLLTLMLVAATENSADRRRLRA